MLSQELVEVDQAMNDLKEHLRIELGESFLLENNFSDNQSEKFDIQ